MQPPAENTEPGLEIVPQNIIRVETALSRFPIHHLGKRATVKINIREKGRDGELRLRWSVKHQPGPLAYKLDTLVVNRRIEEASRPVPKIIKLGSLRQICRELGVSEGKGTQNVKDAIYRNAEAFITAKTSFKLKEGGERTLEAGFSRYSVIFTGEQLPDGRRADAVYIVLNDLYMQVLNGAMTRPLDYDYLKELPPASQRFYEILSYQVFAALKNNRPTARLVYSEFCTYAPQTRYLDYDRVKKQMYKVHALHRKSGYIRAVDFEHTTDADGHADWVMHYTPGPKARAEFRAFTKRGGPVLIEMEPLEEPSELHRLLIERGVTPSTAAELVGIQDEADIRDQLEVFDWMVTKKDKRVSKNPGGFLSEAIRKGYKPPKGFESKAERERKEAARKDQARKAEEAKRQAAEKERAQEEAYRTRITAYLDSLTPDERKSLEAEALASPNPFYLQRLRSNKGDPETTARYTKLIIDEHVTKLLDNDDG